MSSNNRAGLCAPTTDDWATQVGLTEPVQHKVKGAIFKLHDNYKPYYLAFRCGSTNHKELAHVYTCEEIRRLTKDGWANKSDGKWILVYE